jgi:hypothetical protein
MLKSEMSRDTVNYVRRYRRQPSEISNSNSLEPDLQQYDRPTPVLWHSSILPPPSSNFAFAPARKKFGAQLKCDFQFFNFLKFPKSEIA